MRMRTSSTVLSRTTARNCFLINQLATPGLGSLMARHYFAGAGQLSLALIGAGLVIVWFFKLMIQMLAEVNEDSASKPVSWLGELGAAIFILAWIWALFTSLSLLRQAKVNEPPFIPQP